MGTNLATKECGLLNSSARQKRVIENWERVQTLFLKALDTLEWLCDPSLRRRGKTA